MYKIVLALFALSFAASQVDARHPRVYQAVKEKDKPLDFALISVFFEQKWTYCGGVRYKGKWVLTTKSCVHDPEEKYSNITVSFPGPGSSIKGGYRVSKVETVEPVVPGIEGWNYEKDFALLYIPTLDVTKINAVKNTEAGIAALMDDATSMYVNTVYRACGVGSTKDSPNFPQKDVICGNVTVVPIDKCAARDPPLQAAIPAQAGTNYVCVTGNNPCAGDYGGALYDTAYKVVGLYSYSPNFIKGSGCTASRHIIANTIDAATSTWLGATAV